MRRPRILLVTVAVVAVGAIVWHARSGGGEVDFNEDIRPILNEKCAVCHGGVRREAELSLLFREDALAPAESGEHAIVPGRPGRSELIRRVTLSDPEERMPLDHPPLSDREIDLLKRWIDEGAPWDPHWAYVAPTAQDVPDVSDPDWPRGGIDRFVLARLDRESLEPSPEAGCAVMLRRVSLDLVGLPPASEDAEAFCADPSTYETAVDSLLASRRFGERWAAYWLDLARYADSNGYEKDTPRTIWKYRDWVIRAFNEDMSFDRFSTQQLAGDLMPDPSPDRLVATAFHRNTMTNTEGGTDDEEFRTAAVIDRLNTTFEVWQSTTIGCVQCHGHPYDPIRHEEFYELLAFFNNTADADRDDNEPKLSLFDDDEAERGRALVARLETLENLVDVEADSLSAWTTRLEAYARDGDRPPTFEGRTVAPQIIRIARKDLRSPHERSVLRDLFVETRLEFETLRAERARIRGAISELAPITTPIMKELPASELRWTHVFERGNWLARGERVEPDVPQSLPEMPADAPRDRLGLARWLFSAENPLTARVAVNRFWEQLFGTGLVETVEDFGTQGERPSHPELLDWLALRFAGEFDWSVKRLLKEIVMSATYRQSSRVTPELLEADPSNRLLARGPRFRLSAEQIRDQALAVSGLLSGEMNGPSVYPPQPPGLWTNPYSALTWETSEGEDRYRRALYTYLRRTVPYPSLLAFDATSREMCVSRRIRTNTPLQSLVTLNDPVYVEAAVALARRMHAEGGDGALGQLRRGYRLALQQEPPAETLAILLDLYERALADYRRNPTDARDLLDINKLGFADYRNDVARAEADGEVDAVRARASAGAEAVRARGADSNPDAALAQKANGSSNRVLVQGADGRSTALLAAAASGDPEIGALAVVANAILNLDAFLTKG